MAQTTTWRITNTGRSAKEDGAFHLHEGTDRDDSLRITRSADGGLGQTWLNGALSVTGHGRIEDVVGTSGPSAMPALAVRGTLAEELSYQVQVDAHDPKLVRRLFETTDLRRAFRAGDAIFLNRHVDIVEKVEQEGAEAGKQLYLTQGVPPEKLPRSGVTLQRDSDLLVVQNGAGEPKLVVDRSGQVTATAFVGALEAGHLQGTVALARLPPLPASQITEGVLEVGRIPDLPASKITAGELSVERIPNLDAAKITAGTLHADRIPALGANKITEGTLDVARLPNLPATKITEGILEVGRIPDLPASKITAGELSVQRIPNLDAVKITAGTLHVDRLPDLPVSKITGLQAALDSKLNTAGGIIAGGLTVKPSVGPAIMSLQSGESGYGTLELRYKHEDSKDRIGFTDSLGAWMVWSEYSSNNLYVKGNLGIGTDPGADKLTVQGNAMIYGTLHVGVGASSIAPNRVNAVYASNNGDAGIAIAQNSGVNVLVQASGAGGYIGTTSNHPLVFRTNDRDRMSIDTNGNLHVAGTVYMANPVRHRMYPADPQVYQDIFAARDAGVISKLGNPTYDDTAYQTNPWDDGRSLIRYGVNNEQDGHGARVVIPQGYDTVWVRVLGERWNVIHAYFLDGGGEDLGLWTGGYRSANCYCPDGSLSDGYSNRTQWLPIPAGRAGALALISKPNTDKEFWLSGLAFSKNPWAHAAQSAVGYHWHVNDGDQVPWNTHDWNSDMLANIAPKTNSLLKVPVVPNKRDKLLYLIEHNSNWNGCMHTAITVNNSPIERFLATYDNPFARHWNSKLYERYIAARIPAALIPDGARYLDVRIDMSMQDNNINFREIGTHDLEIPTMG